jgi:cytochrome b561
LPAKVHYDAVAIALHWLIALAIASQLIMGFSMTALRPGSFLQFQLYQAHKSVGMTILALSVLRLGWRLMHVPPPLPAAMPIWEQRLARITHAVLYMLMLGMPLSGWAVVSASPLNIPTVLYGTVPLPHLPILSTLSNKKAIEPVLEGIHEAGAWILVALLVGHIAAAWRHHVLLRDDVLIRMLPRRFSNRL